MGEEERLLMIGLEYSHLYLRNYVRNIHIKNLFHLIVLYMKDFSEEKMRTVQQNEFLRQTPFFPFQIEQEKNAVYIFIFNNRSYSHINKAIDPKTFR